MDLADLRTRLDETLAVDDYDDVDAAANGLQVGPESKGVERIAFAVDGVLATFEAAAEWGADALVVHHGVSWGGFDAVTGPDYDRVVALVESDLALYAAHLPLDGHPELGNAARLADHLGLEDAGAFGHLGPVTVGRRAVAPEPLPVGTVRERLADLPTGDRDVRVLDFGPERVEDVALLTGSGTDWVEEARVAGVDALVTGEGKQQAYHEAREAGLNVFLAGHYATETFGVRALRDLVEGWDEGVETTYLEHPTGL